MSKMKNEKMDNTSKSVVRTVRMSGASYDKIELIAEEKNVSFNSVANKLIEYSLDRLSND